jgi:hypothetical protein
MGLYVRDRLFVKESWTFVFNKDVAVAISPQQTRCVAHKVDINEGISGQIKIIARTSAYFDGW